MPFKKKEKKRRLVANRNVWKYKKNGWKIVEERYDNALMEK